MRIFISCLSLLTILAIGCQSKKEQTTPDKDQTKNEEPNPEEEVKPTPTTVPAEYEQKVQQTWNFGISAVTNCVKKQVAKTKQKGLTGYIIVEGTIGKTKYPQDLKIVSKSLKVDNIEKCIVDYLKDLEFPTWGYPVKYQHSYSLNILY
ncbi:MAG: hypothetical protein PF689_01325 [Deltaproteobacteria bacterium]|nr:hypothetical protein [Deltaproteobacteria bacterium]